ncbi:DeoR/GlpR family DNA-binding transcription regulator [Microbacterium testaceum]|uniref:DeoR/GlpR family DNA-binding transcription regulator n=1 Tax=Microbacterium testaceum TaxID=2033 RepID=UPI0021565CC9|nr:DeoR/GlpR family DNA-binding transcription regulator [Microbacterium testaceum]WJS91022.1 DeoR/GlpR family DNA-binding transcription regulator [Microbacterium testaceum]
MLTHQREAAIVERLEAVGSVTVDELSRLLGVSGTTIRRDLERLEQRAHLRRVHGGATIARTPESGQDGELDDDTREKEALARATADLIVDGQVVLLDIGITTRRLARHLRGRPVTVITNSLAVLDALGDDDVASLVLLGGMVGGKTRTLIGPFTEQALGRVHADIAVISSTGVKNEGAVVTDLTHEATIKGRMREAADRSILVANTSKFPGSGSYRIASLGDFDTIVTTDRVESTALTRAARGGVEVIRA